MNSEFDADNGSREKKSEAEGSSWPFGPFVSHLLAGFGVAIVLLLAAWVGGEYALSRLDWRFDNIDRRFDWQDRRFGQQDKRFDRQDRRFDRQDNRFGQQDKRFDRQDRRMDRIESTTADGMRLSHDRMDRIVFTVDSRFRQTHDRNDRTDARIDRLETKVYVIEALLDQGQLRVVVEGEESTPTVVFVPNALSGTKIPLPR